MINRHNITDSIAKFKIKKPCSLYTDGTKVPTDLNEFLEELNEHIPVYTGGCRTCTFNQIETDDYIIFISQQEDKIKLDIHLYYNATEDGDSPFKTQLELGKFIEDKARDYEYINIKWNGDTNKLIRIIYG